MDAPVSHRRWLLALASLAALLAVNVAPLASSASSPLAVGDLLVDATGRVTGANLAASLDESTGTLSGLSVGGTPVFDAVKIDGFAQAQKLQGVASPVLHLEGSNAALSLVDSADAALRVATTAPTAVRFALAPGVDAALASPGVIDLTQGSQWLGSIVAVGADSAKAGAASLSLASDGSAIASAKPGSDLLFLAAPDASAAQPLARAVVEAAAHGDLASSFVTDLAGRSPAQSAQLDAAPGAFDAATRIATSGVETIVSSAGASPAVLHYDLAYETLPAHAASDVAVYVDGALAARAQSAEDVLSLARQGVAAYSAVVQDGRTLVLASTSDFLSSTEHHVSVQVSHALTEGQAQAEAGSALHDITGELVLHANGKVTGGFLSGVVGHAGTIVSQYTSLATRDEIFDAVSAEGNAPGAIQSLDATHLRVSGSKLDATLVDDAFGTLVLDAKGPATDATFRLAPGIDAQQLLSNVVQLTSADGSDAGTLVALSGTLHATTGDVTAHLGDGSRVIFRGATDGFGSEAALAQGLANGRVGAQLLASSDATSAASYVQGTLAKVAKRGSDALDVEYAASADAAKAFVVDARGTALAAKSASDIIVLVDGQPAVPVSNAQTALALGSQARSFVESASDGALRIVVNAAHAAGQTAHVTIESRSALSKDGALGAFKLFPDGTAIGDFVELHVARASGAVSNVGSLVDGHEVFRSIAIGESPFQATGVDGAASLALENAEGSIHVLDAASALATLRAKAPTDVALALADGVRASSAAQGVVQLTAADGSSLGSLVLTPDTGSLNVVADQVSARLAPGQQLVWHANAGARGELSDAQKQLIDEAIAQGKVAGEVAVSTSSALPGTLQTSSVDALGQAADITSTASAAFGDVQMATSATSDRVQVTVASATSVGKTLLLQLDPRTVAGLASGQADVLFDGQPIHQASNLADVLDATNDGGAAEYLVLAGDAGEHVLVSIPHFSTHTVTIESRGAAAGSTPGYLYASIFLGLLVAVETALLIRNKHRRN